LLKKKFEKGKKKKKKKTVNSKGDVRDSSYRVSLNRRARVCLWKSAPPPGTGKAYGSLPRGGNMGTFHRPRSLAKGVTGKKKRKKPPKRD